MAIDLERNLLVSLVKLVPTIARMINMACFHTARIYREVHLGAQTRSSTTDSLLNHSLSTINEKEIPSAEKISSLSAIQFQQTEIESSIPTTPSDTPSTQPICHQENVIWERNFDSIMHNKNIINDPFNAWLEKFVKVTINYKVSPRKLIPITNKDGKTEHYKVFKKIAKDGLLAFALKPVEKGSSLSPLIVFRATETDIFAEESLSSIQNDLDARIGERGWKASQEEFKALMDDPHFRDPNQKVKVAGYSLGGAHAQYFILNHFSNVSYGCFHNNPSVHSDVADSFAQKINESEIQDPLVLQIFRTEGDICHHFGGKHLGCGVDHPNVNTQLLEIRYQKQTMFDLSLHSRRIFDTSRFDYRVIECANPKQLVHLLDNTKRDPISYYMEKTRSTFGKFFAALIGGIATFLTWIFKKLGFKISRGYQNEYNVHLQS